MTTIFYTDRDINYDLLKEINTNKSKLENNLEYPYKLRESLSQGLITECNAHSLRIEKGTTNVQEINQKESIEPRQLSYAWDWASNKYKGHLSREFLVNLVNLIEPEAQEVETIDKPSAPGYRASNIHFPGNEYISASNYQSIDNKMEELFGFLNNQSIDPVARAIFGHLHIANIHPFYDGNGRISRMVQNLILIKNNYLPICIERPKKFLYFDLLRKALKGMDEPGVNGKKLFFELLASEENSCLEKVTDLLEKNRNYIIEYPGEKNEIFTIKHRLDGYIKTNKPGQMSQVRVDKNKKQIQVTGNISQNELNQFLNKLNLSKRVRIRPE